MNKQQILDLMARADRMRHPIRNYKNTVVCLFDKPTPTLLSFQAAASRLGCTVLTMSEENTQSAHAYGDLVVMNPETTQNQEIDRMAEFYALYKELHFRSIELDSTDREPLHVTFLGYSRNVQPFVYLLQRFPKIEFHYVSQEEIDPEVQEMTDVFYVSPFQEGDKICLDKAFLNKTKHTAIVLRTHPYDDTEIWHNPRCIYSTQPSHGVYMRMAILDRSLSTLSWPSVYEMEWFLIDGISDGICYVVYSVGSVVSKIGSCVKGIGSYVKGIGSYVSKGWSILTGSALVKRGV
jgi:aspartate carbamoyltransferase catalytic subunit